MFVALNHYAKQVDKGANLLDRVNPEWFNTIDESTLDMSSCTRCALGKTFASYCIGLAKLGLTDDLAADYGFVLPLSVMWHPCEWNELREAWLDIIISRRMGVLTPAMN